MKNKFKNHEKFSDKEASKIMKGILEGVAYIHEKSISHRDLKPQNILITDDHIIKLIDFGLGNQ
jgi:serine/threonine protein kinase